MKNTEKKVIFFAPYMKDGESAALHPLCDYLDNEAGKEGEGHGRVKDMIRNAADLVGADGVWSLGDRTAKLKKANSLLTQAQ